VGHYHTCALVNGGVRCWGENTYGELGVDPASNASTSVPVQVTGLTTGVTAIAAGYQHTCALVNGGAQCWGYNLEGELGHQSSPTCSGFLCSPVPVDVDGLTSGVTAIAAGWTHTCALVNGGVQCWGWNDLGELGDNSTTNSSAPVDVEGLTSGVTAIAAGDKHTCALVNGGVQCWGYNDFGELGHQSSQTCYSGLPCSTVPVDVEGLTSGVTAIAAGGYHTCALVNGGAQCWGWNGYGQLGNGSTTDSTSPVRVSGLTSGVQAIAARSSYTCAVVDGGAQCWGDNSYGELGNNSTTESLVPVDVEGLTSAVTAIAAGWSHACAVVNGGTRCWGDNSYGELGNNSTTGSLVPVQVR
jgi:alpha-tubulin suppressor-like RCC1 family protein